MTVFGALAAIIGWVGILGLEVAVGAYGRSVMLYPAYIAVFLGAVAEYAVGIIGFIVCGERSKAKPLFICGIVIIAVTASGSLVSVIFYSAGLDMFGLISGLLFPVFFTVSAALMKKGSAGHGQSEKNME